MKSCAKLWIKKNEIHQILQHTCMQKKKKKKRNLGVVLYNCGTVLVYMHKKIKIKNRGQFQGGQNHM